MASEQPSSEVIFNRLYEVKQELALKAANDSAFRQSLQADPLATIEKEYGLPAGVMAQSGLNIEIVEEKPNTLMVPIPLLMDDMELSDDQLEAVAGGTDIFSLVIGPIASIVGSQATQVGQQIVTGAQESFLGNFTKKVVNEVAPTPGW